MKWEVGIDLYQYEMYRQLERDIAAYLPLKTCTAHWGYNDGASQALAECGTRAIEVEQEI